jgi:mitofilin
LQTTNADVKKSRTGNVVTSFLVAGSVVALSYSGAVYYSLSDNNFRATFVQYVPGAQAAIHFAEDWTQHSDNSSGPVVSLKQQAQDYRDVMKEYTEMAKSVTSDSYDYLQNAYAKLTGQTTPPKLPSQMPSWPTEEHNETSEKVIEKERRNNEKSKAVDSNPSAGMTDKPSVTSKTDQQIKEEPTDQKLERDTSQLEEKPTEMTSITTDAVMEPIILSDVTLNHQDIENLRQIMGEITQLLNESNLSDKGRGAIIDAEEQLMEIDQKLNRIHEKHKHIMDGIQRTSEKLEALGHIFNMIDDGYNEKIYVAQKYTEGQVEEKEKELSEIFYQERVALVADFNAKLTKQMDEERQKFVVEKTAQLVDQQQELEKSYTRQVQNKVEVEGGGRFGGLDNLVARLAVLEKHAYETALLIDNASFSHRLTVAISALDKATDKGFMRSFSHELSALRKLASTAYGSDKELMELVLNSIPDGLEYEGVQSMSELRSRFNYLADEVRQSSLISENGGIFSHMISITLSKLMFKKHGLVPGEDIEARLARAEHYLKENDLDSAARELNQLTGWPKKLASGWVNDARKRLEVKQVIKVRSLQSSKIIVYVTQLTVFLADY